MKSTALIILIISIISCDSKKIIQQENIELSNVKIEDEIKVDTIIQSDSTSKASFEKEIIESDTLIDFKNRVFTYASNTHQIDCDFFLECDCCHGNLLFLPKNDFYYIDYCMSDWTVTIGKYSIENEYLIIKSDSIKVQHLYNWENEIDTSAVDFFVTDSIISPYKDRFAIKICGNEIKLVNVEDPKFIAITNNENPNQLLGELREAGIIDRISKYQKQKK